MSEPGSETYSRAYVRYAMGVVLLVAMFNVIDRTIISMLVPAIKSDLGLDDAQMGLLMGPAFAIVHLFAVLPAAWIADRTSRKTVIAVALTIWSGMTALGAAAVGFWSLFATRMGVGIGEAGGAPPSVSLLSDTAPESMRARALSAITIGALFGIGVGLIAGGYLAEPIGWRGTLIAVGVPGLAIALLVQFTLREPRRATVESATPVQAAKHLFGLPTFRWMVFAVVLAGVGGMGRTMWEPEVVRRAYGYDGLTVGVTVFVYGALPTALGAYLGSAIADRLRPRDERWPLWVCAIGNLLSTPLIVAFMLMPATLSFAGIPAAFWFWMGGAVLGGFFSAPMGAMAQNLARPNMRALAHAIWTLIFTGLGGAAGPWLVGSLAEAWRPTYGDDSLRYAIAASSVGVALSGLVYLVAARHVRGDLARLRHERS